MKKCILTLFILMMLGFSAQAQTLSRNETVYVTLDSQGKPQKTEVVTWLRTDGKGPSQDAALLKDVKNIRGAEPPVQSPDGKITFAAPAKDIFYSGTTAKTLPVGVAIRYRLNGQPVKREAINGRSGRLEVAIDLKNQARMPRQFTYKEVGTGKVKVAREEIPVPFIVMVSMDLDIEQFNNVVAPDGAFAVVGRTMKMNWIAFPFPDHSIKLTADIVNARMPAIMFTVIPKFPTLPEVDVESKLNQIYGGVDTLGGYLVKLEDGARQLNGGQKMMLDALEQVNDGTGKLILASNAQIEITNGAIKINEGMSEKFTPLTKVPLVSGKAGEIKHYLDIQKELLQLATQGGPFSEKILAFLKEQGKEAPPVAEFPGIKVTTDGITKLHDGSKQMIDGAKKLEDGSKQLADALGQLKKQGTDAMKKGIIDGADPLVRKLASVEVAKKMAVEYDRFAGKPGTVKSSVEFIMKTPD